MDAVLIALLALAPFFIVAGAIAWWVRRARDPMMAQRRRRISFAILFVVLGIWANRTAIGESRLYRKVSGTCMVRLTNESGIELRDVEMVTRASAEGEADVSHWDTMNVRSGTWLKTRVDELKVESLKGTCGTNVFSFRGVVKKGQKLTVRIEAGGKEFSRFVAW